MKRAGAIAQRHGCFRPNPSRRNLDEVAWVHKLFPDCQSYTEVYQRAGLLGPRTILGHCIYLADEEITLLKASTPLSRIARVQRGPRAADGLPSNAFAA